jgi:hypothetical protein
MYNDSGIGYSGNIGIVEVAAIVIGLLAILAMFLAWREFASRKI